MEGSASFDHHRRSSIVDRDRGLHQNARTAVMHRDIGNLSLDDGRSSQKWITIRSSSDGRRSMTKNCDRNPIVTRSRRDQSSIVPRLGPSFVAESFQLEQTAADRDPGPRSTLDRGLIVARSWPDRATIGARFEAKFKSNSLRN